MVDQDYIRLREIKPALAGYIRDAQTLLNASPAPGEKAIHDVRVLMKKSRAVLRLIDACRDNEIFQRDYLAFREVGRLLGSLRDTSVQRKTIKELKKDNSRLFTLLKNNAIISEMSGKPSKEAGLTGAAEFNLQSAREIIRKAGYRIRFSKMEGIEPDQLLKSLDSTYRIVARRYLIARNKPSPENLHLFRKKAKDMLYQLWFFRPLNPSGIKSLERKLDTLTQNLGKYNDFSQLIRKLCYDYKSAVADQSVAELVLVLNNTRDKYLSRVWPSAFRIFRPGRSLVNVLGFRLLAS